LSNRPLAANAVACIVERGRHDGDSELAGRHRDQTSANATHFIIAREGRIAAVYLFFDKLP